MSEGRGPGPLVVALAACAMLCASEIGNAAESNAGHGVYPTDSTENSVKTTSVEQSESLHVLDATPPDLHVIIENLRAPRAGTRGKKKWVYPLGGS